MENDPEKIGLVDLLNTKPLKDLKSLLSAVTQQHLKLETEDKLG